MVMEMRKRKQRVFEVTGGQVLFVLIIAAVALTVVFEAGVWVGKQRVIKAEQEAALRGDIQTREAAKASTEVKSPHISSSDQSAEQSEVEEKGADYTVQVGAFNSRQNAENTVELLESYEYKPWLRPELDKEKTLYCVFIGKFDTKAEAEQFGKSLRETLSFITDYQVRKMRE